MAAGHSGCRQVTHRLGPRAEDRIRWLKDIDATNLPLQAFDSDLTTWIRPREN